MTRTPPASDFSTRMSLSPARSQLLELVQRYDFCMIENIKVRGGEPVFTPSPLVAQEIKIGAVSSPRSDAHKNDFLLQSQIIELFEHLNRLGEGRIAVLEVRHRLPFRLVIERSTTVDVP